MITKIKDKNKLLAIIIKPNYLKGLTFHYVSQMMEVLEISLTTKKAKNFKKLD